MFRAFLKWLLVLLELFLAAGAFFGGTQLLRDPSGQLLQMPANQFLTERSLFSDWMIPGFILLVAIGVFPLVVAVAAVLNAKWVKYGHVGVGVVLLGWMLVQGLMLGFGAPIQVVYLLYGVVLTLLGALHWVLIEQEHVPTGRLIHR